jgi:hypothetical protein
LSTLTKVNVCNKVTVEASGGAIPKRQKIKPPPVTDKSTVDDTSSENGIESSEDEEEEKDDDDDSVLSREKSFEFRCWCAAGT